MIKRIALLVVLLLCSVLFLGCPGNTSLDKKAQQDLWAWIEQQEAAGWAITGWPDTENLYKNVIVDHRFRPTRLDIAIPANTMNYFHQRNWIEDIVRKWRNCYPANMYPRYELKVYLYETTISNDTELGFTIIDKDGNVETHHGKTGDVL
jgi:hypothetical protein